MMETRREGKPMKLNLKYISLLAILSAGCHGNDASPTTEPTASVSYAPQQIQFVGGGDLSQCLAFQPITRSFDSAGLMHVSIPARLTSDLGQTIEYRFTFFDDNHSPVDAPSAWITKSLAPDVTVNIEGSSTSPRARDFQVEFRSSAS
jgi:hypothetical protein